MKLKKKNILQNVNAFTVPRVNEIIYIQDKMIFRNTTPLMTTQRPSNLKCNANWITYYENTTRESVVFSSNTNAEVFRFNNVIITLLEEGILSRDKDGHYLRDYTNGEIIWESKIKTRRAINHKGEIIVFHGLKNSIISSISKSDGSVNWETQLDFNSANNPDRVIVCGVYDDVLWLRFSERLIGLSLINGGIIKDKEETSLDLKGSLRYSHFDTVNGIFITGIIHDFSKLDLNTNEVNHFHIEPGEMFKSFRQVNRVNDFFLLIDDSLSKICLTDLDFNLLSITKFADPDFDDIQNGIPIQVYCLNESSLVIKDTSNNFHFYEIQ